MELIYLYITLFCLYCLYDLLNRIIKCIEKIVNGNSNIIFNVYLDNDIFNLNIREILRNLLHRNN